MLSKEEACPTWQRPPSTQGIYDHLALLGETIVMNGDSKVHYLIEFSYHHSYNTWLAAGLCAIDATGHLVAITIFGSGETGPRSHTQKDLIIPKIVKKFLVHDPIQYLLTRHAPTYTRRWL